MERRGRIPVAKFRTQEGKTRSRSRVREPDYNEQDPETDLFTLLEDNIALKEENKSLKTKIEDNKKIQNDLLEENAKMRDEFELLKVHQQDFSAQIKEISTKLTRTANEKSALDKLHKIKVEQVNSLTAQLKSLQASQADLSTAVIDSIELKSKILKIIPSLAASNEMESLIDLESSVVVSGNAKAAANLITNECIEQLVDEFLTLKNTMGSVELQLYEANEKISELLENQHHLEEENETLRSENTNLTRVAQLLTENMKESVDTSKKMEEALMKLKQRNDELSLKARDITDGQPAPTPSPTTIKANQEFELIRDEVRNQNRDHGERIVEMKSLMDAAIEKTTNDELKTLQLKMEILEEELRLAIARAERAENELEKCKRQSTNATSSVKSRVDVVSPPPPPPPPPPPIPASLLYCALSNNRKSNDDMVDPTFMMVEEQSDETATTNTFNKSIMSHTLRRGSVSSSGGACRQQVETATGLDALVRELKSGKVTLRRNRRKTRTSEALQEMFKVLEVSQKQNRNSQICIDIHR